MIIKTNFWRRIEKLLGLAQLYKPMVTDDLPDNLDLATVYLIGEGTPWSAALVCPCGCGATIQLSLIPNDDPRWKVKDHGNGRVSLHPSIWRTKGCESHFWLKNNRVVWALERRNQQKTQPRQGKKARAGGRY